MKKPKGKREYMDKLLLDTTYLLPLFGVGVKLEGFTNLLPGILNEYTVLYNPISIVESKWIVLRLMRRHPSMRENLLITFRDGLRVLLESEKLVQTSLTSPEVEEVADRLLIEGGVKDYFDRIIYATAVKHNLTLLTEDKDLLKLTLIKEMPKPKKVIKWSELTNL